MKVYVCVVIAGQYEDDKEVFAVVSSEEAAKEKCKPRDSRYYMYEEFILDGEDK